MVVAADEVHGIDDSRQGMGRAFLFLGGLLVAVAILIGILALTGSLTGFGSEPPGALRLALPSALEHRLDPAHGSQVAQLLRVDHRGDR